jgi:hypothetical protein
MSILSPIMNTFEPVSGTKFTSPGVHCLTESAARVMEERGIKIVKQPQSAIIPSRKAQALHRIEQMASELGRMQKLLDELRADVVHLTVE